MESLKFTSGGLYDKLGVCLGVAGEGLNSQGVYDLIVFLLPFVHPVDLDRLLPHIAEMKSKVELNMKPWKEEGFNADNMLTFEEKAYLLQIPCRSNPPDSSGYIPMRKIEAIKSIRDRLSYGLRQAKWLVDEYLFMHTQGKTTLPVMPDEEMIPSLCEETNLLDEIPEELL